MNKYKGIVRYNGNHYFAGEEVKGSKIMVEDGRLYLFDDEPVEFLGTITADEWVEVSEVMVLEDAKADYIFPEKMNRPVNTITMLDATYIRKLEKYCNELEKQLESKDKAIDELAIAINKACREMGLMWKDSTESEWREWLLHGE